MTNNDIMEWVLVNVLGFAALFIRLDNTLIVVNIVLALVLIVYNLIRIKQMLREEKKKGDSKSDTP